MYSRHARVAPSFAAARPSPAIMAPEAGLSRGIARDPGVEGTVAGVEPGARQPGGVEPRLGLAAAAVDAEQQRGRQRYGKGDRADDRLP